MKNIPRKSQKINDLPLFRWARASQLRRRPPQAAIRLARRYGVSIDIANAIIQANDYGPREDR